MVTWDDGKMFKLSSLVIFSDSLYVAWFKDRLKYDEYVSEMKDAIEKSHKRFAKTKAKKSATVTTVQQSQAQQQQQHQTLTLTTASDGQLFLA